MLDSAQSDLTKIDSYIRDHLHSPLNAKNVQTKLLKGLSKLTYSAEGAPWLKNRLLTIDKRYAILQYQEPYKNYLAFFYLDKVSKTVFVLNILSTKQNISLLFGDKN